MRKFWAIIGAILLGLTAVVAVLLIQGKDLKTIFSFGDSTRQFPRLPTIEEEAQESQQQDLSYEERIKKGDEYVERGFLSYAVNEYVKAADLAPNQVTPYFKLLETHMKLGNYQKALNNAEFILEKNPNDLNTRFQLVAIHIKLSDFQSARSVLETHFQNSSDPKVLYYKALLSSLSAAHDQARSYLELVKTSASAEWSPKADKILKAYAEFDLTKAADPLFLSELLAKSFNEIQEYEMAIYLIKEVLKTRADLRDGWILLGFAYLNLKNDQFALTAFDKAYSLDSTWAPTLYFLGVVHKELGDLQQAINYLSAAQKAKFEPKPVIDSLLADLYFETQDYQKAAEAYEAVLALNQNQVDSYVRPIWIYIDYLDQPQRALELAEAAAFAFPESAMSYNLLGWSYMGLNDYKRALSNLNRSIKLDPDLPAAHYNLGQLYEKQNKLTEALQSYRKANQLDSSGSIGRMAATSYNAILQSQAN